MTQGKLVQVAIEHASSFPHPLVARAGTGLSLERRSSEFPGWVWGRDSGGTEAWVPEIFLEISEGRAVLLTDYDSTELTVSAGATVEILDEVAGWAWCRDPAGRAGWLPISNLTVPS